MVTKVALSGYHKASSDDQHDFMRTFENSCEIGRITKAPESYLRSLANIAGSSMECSRKT